MGLVATQVGQADWLLQGLLEFMLKEGRKNDKYL